MTVTREEVVQKIDKYLKGEISKKEICDWATDIMMKTKNGELESDIGEAITELFGLHHEGEEEKFDTPIEDIEKTLKKLQEKVGQE